MYGDEMDIPDAPIPGPYNVAVPDGGFTNVNPAPLVYNSSVTVVPLLYKLTICSFVNLLGCI